ncbi:carbohydrate ABC transporter permease [Lacrimispora algidixylanolytica]|uniref:Sugar ABC transporter permease n=1 Tax=Lacrimispora algidixylanolytica TaxID=94868 RepID=A0A419SY44_9FIRM|nr:carbohydrate ABC transporter permease [Lacrimispora algidixylanolytica]RKD30180.1 sugar ABC transporter permease [Lacrimispora algidixylanolytica]
MKNKGVKMTASTAVVRMISYFCVTVFSLLCLLPFLLMVSASFSNEGVINREGFGLLPKGFTMTAYSWVFRYPKMILGSYGVTILMTVCGTIIGLFLIAMTGYALQRQDFPLRNVLSFFIYFTTLFTAGMAPTYIWVSRYLNLKGSYMAVFLQLLMTPWLIILMKNFAKSVPYEITESGKMDGADDFKIFTALILPMLKPALATVGLFLALGYWNEWYNSMLYLGSAVTYKPLQYYLYNIVNTAAQLKNSMAGAAITITDLPTNTLKMATAVVATGPIIFLYPFVQRYFITGITIGAVKG